MAVVRELRIYPVKGLDPLPVDAVRVLPSGALENDRRWALVDSRGRFVNGKNYAALHAIRARFADGEIAVDGRAWSLARQPDEIARWFSERLNEPMELRENAGAGFPDDTDSPGPTLATTSSLDTVAAWFDLDPGAARLRFRANIEIGGEDVPAFWEDRLYGSALLVGAVRLLAVNPCARCVVPSRDALTGVPLSGFQKRFAELRRANLPAGARSALFDHFYRFAVNTRLAGPPGIVRVGDIVVAED